MITDNYEENLEKILKKTKLNLQNKNEKGRISGQNKTLGDSNFYGGNRGYCIPHMYGGNLNFPVR